VQSAQEQARSGMKEGSVFSLLAEIL